ncbi:MAG: class II fructose-bisphosphate aldolase [Patescibacteria group bacterium]
MMNVASELRQARAGGYAIGAFNTSNLEVTKAICSAAMSLGAPVLIQTTPSAIEYAGLTQLYDIVIDEIAASGIKAAIHLDHGKDWDITKRCIDAGYTSVMIDGSKLPYKENLELTKKVVDYAHARGASVEGEIGVLGAKEIGESGSDASDVLSSPEQTAEFVTRTGIDSVAVAIGNSHGAPQHEEINLTLLKEISLVVDIPLVIHGSSGLSDDQIKEAINLGVAKFNVDTLIRRAVIDSLQGVKPDEKDYRDVFRDEMEEIERVVRNRIELFRNNE